MYLLIRRKSWTKHKKKRKKIPHLQVFVGRQELNSD